MANKRISKETIVILGTRGLEPAVVVHVPANLLELFWEIRFLDAVKFAAHEEVE